MGLASPVLYPLSYDGGCSRKNGRQLVSPLLKGILLARNGAIGN
jgi:hypothetical protein